MKPYFQNIISKIISLWMFIVIITISTLIKYEDNEEKDFYKFGPNEDLIILGFKVNNNTKYTIVVSYCFLNSLIRTLYNSILHPWLINNIQDEGKAKYKELNNFSYEVSMVTTAYMWFVWFIYMNILLSQIDMVLVEISADIVMSLLTTKYYLNIKNNNSELSPLLENKSELA